MSSCQALPPPLPTAARVLAILLTLGAAANPASAQDGPRPTPPARRDLGALQGIELRYPRDQNRAVATVDGREITLGEVARHIEENGNPGFVDFLSTPAGNLYFEKRLPADWVRLYADVAALRAEAHARELPAETIRTKLADAAARGYSDWLHQYEEQRREQGVETPLSDEAKANLQARHRREVGLGDERQGWLDVLTPELENVGIDAAHHFYREHPRCFGGVVHLAHILVYDRHPVTGQLLVDGDRAESERLLREVRARLARDGSNFEEVARLFSEDRRSGERGGILRNVSRFDPRLPPSVTRAAWELQDGDWVGPIESSFGLHFVKRLSYTHYAFFLVTESTLPKVRDVMRRLIQEDTMLEVRQRHRVKLLY